MTPHSPSEHYLEHYLTELGLSIWYDYGGKLVEVSGRSAGPMEARVFEVSKAPLPATLSVYRTRRSLNLSTPEYQLRVVVTLRRNQLALVARHRSDADRLSMLGALDPEGRTVRSHAFVSPGGTAAWGSILVAALMHSGTSIEAGLREVSGLSAFAGGGLRPRLRYWVPKAAPLSEADLEAHHFDHAHLHGSLENGSWRLKMADADLWLSPVNEAPGLGSGFLLHLRMPRETFRLGERQLSATELNIVAHDLSDIPVFGSWSEDAMGYSYRSFATTTMGRQLSIAEYYVAWGMQLAAQARSLAEQYPQRPS